MNTDTAKKTPLLANIAIILLAVGLAFGGYRYYGLHTSYAGLQKDSSDKIASLETTLSQTQLEKTSLSDALTAEQQKNDEFEQQIEKLSGKVGTLVKLSQTDPELLKKYSKVYFLNENYMPKNLKKISTRYLFDTTENESYLSDAWPFLQDLMNRADGDGLNLRVVSAYRSFTTQASLKTTYKVIYGAGTANQFSADQGYSEHQLGTAVDFTNEAMGSNLVIAFENSEEFKWLQQNAYKYGFELSYPKGNTYYQYEPWHWRFVGTALAQKLHDQGINFYDMDQRDIDKYLVTLFD